MHYKNICIIAAGHCLYCHLKNYLVYPSTKLGNWLYLAKSLWTGLILVLEDPTLSFKWLKLSFKIRKEFHYTVKTGCLTRRLCQGHPTLSTYNFHTNTFYTRLAYIIYTLYSLVSSFQKKIFK